jgi:putative aldouronate transport system substrate-binding protein
MHTQPPLKRFTHRTARRSLLAAAAATCTIGLALSGCTSNSGTTGDDASAPLKTLSIQAPYLSAQPPAAGNEIGTKLDDLLGVKLKINWVPNSSYGDKTNITLAGSNVPQVMVIQGKDAGFVKNAQAGAFWDLTSFLKDYPNLKTESPQVQAASSVNGKVFGIYRPRDQMRAAVIIRKDWLKKLGLSLPKTTADLYNIAKAFTDDDPDGNGQKDTYGLVVPKWPGGFATNSPYDAIETWYGAGNAWHKKDNSLIPAFETPEWLKALNYEKKFVSQGLINPDFATLDSVDWNQPFLSGKGGIIIDTYSRAYQINGLLAKQYPDSYQNMVAVTGNLTGPDGTLRALPTTGYSGFLAIPKSSVKTESELKKVLSVLNKLNTKDAQVLINNGIEGKTFTLKGSSAAAITPATAQSTELTETVHSYAQLGIAVAGYKAYPVAQPDAYSQKFYDDAIAQQKVDLKSAVFNPAAQFVSSTYALKGATLDNIIVDARVKYIAGQIDESQLKSQLKLWETSGGSQVVKETNKLYKAQN